MTPPSPPPLARIRLHPAIIVLGCFYAALIGQRAWTVEVEGATRMGLILGGLGVGGLGLVVLVFAYRAMARAKTTINPRVHTTALVTSGLYRFSRNPIYVGWFLLILGIGMVRRSFFPIAAAVLMIGVLHWAVVLKEEAYLEALFGDEYVRYRESVRRWV